MKSWEETLYSNYATNTNRATLNNSTPTSPVATRLIDTYFPNDRTAHIADLGCGSGFLLRSMHQRGFTDVIGVDVSEEQVLLARERGSQNVICKDIDEYLTSARPHDFIAMVDILEHFDKQEVVNVLSSVYNALVDGGKLLIRVPNAEGFLSQGICFGDFTHQSFFTPGSLSQVLRSVNFEVLQCDNEPLVFVRLRPYIRAILCKAAALPMVLIRKLQSGFNTNVVVTANMLVLAKKPTSTNIAP